MYPGTDEFLRCPEVRSFGKSNNDLSKGHETPVSTIEKKNIGGFVSAGSA